MKVAAPQSRQPTGPRGADRSARPRLASRSPFPGLSRAVQARLHRPVGRGRDPFEDEAEAFAEWLMRARPAGTGARTGTDASGGADTHSPLSPARLSAAPPRAGGWGIAPDPQLAQRILAAAPSGGTPLEPGFRAELESALGVGLERVRVHRGAEAAGLAADLRALAFTAGAHVFLGGRAAGSPASDQRRLLAHEVAHVVQQGQASPAIPSPHRAAPAEQRLPVPAPGSRVQCAFDHSPAELDPKVSILLDIHLRNRGGQFASVGGDLAQSTSWFATFRSQLETPAPATGNPAADAKQRARVVDTQLDAAEAAIRAHTPSSKDPAARKESDRLQNALAGLIVDYLQLNRAGPEAARFLTRFPYCRTVFHTIETGEALAARKDFGEQLLPQIQTQWKIARAGAKPAAAAAAPKEAWAEDIAAVVGDFLALPPLPEHHDARNALAARLERALGLGSLPARTLDSDAFDALDASATPTDNDLVALAGYALEQTRQLAGGVLRQILTHEAAHPGTSAFELWDAAVGTVGGYVRDLGTSASASQRILTARAAQPGLAAITQRDYLLLAATLRVAEGKPLDETLARVVRPHEAFWQRIAELGGREFDPSRHPDLARQLADSGLDNIGRLFFTAHARQLGRALEKSIPALFFNLLDYLDLEVAAGDATDLSWRQPEAVFAHHADKAAALHGALDDLLVPVTRALAAARGGNDPDLADALGWFAVVVVGIQRDLDQVPATLGPEPGPLLGHIEAYRRVATDFRALADFALTPTPSKKAAGTAPAVEAETQVEVPAAAAWKDIRDAAAKAVNLGFVGTSLLVVTQPLEPSEDSDPSRLAKDAGYTIRGLEPFTGAQLALLYQADYQRLLAERLAFLSDAAQAAQDAGNPRTTDDLWLVSKALDEVKATQGEQALPRRYESPDAYWVRYPGDPEGILGSLFRASAPFREWQAAWTEQTTEAPSRRNLAIIGSEELRPELWVWDLPAPTELVQRLHALPVLRGLVAMQEAEFGPHRDALHNAAQRAAAAQSKAPAQPGTPTPAAAAAPPPLDAVLLAELLRVATAVGQGLPPETPADPFDWYRQLVERLDTIRPGAGSEILRQSQFTEFASGTATSDLRADLARARARTAEEMRRATTLDREVIRAKASELLQGALDEPIARMPDIGEAFNLVAGFGAAVTPGSERERTLQIAALVVELLDPLLEIFGDDDPIGSYKEDAYYFLSLAQDALEDLVTPPPATETAADPAKTPGGAATLDSHSQGILWKSEPERVFHADARTSRHDRIAKVLEQLEAELRPLQWELSISADASTGLLHSHLGNGNWAVPTVPVVEARNREHTQKNEELEPDFIDFGGFQVRILEVLQSFTYLPGIGDRARASNPNARGRARYLRGKLLLHQPAASASNIPGNLADFRGVEDPRKDPPAVLLGPDVPLVRVEVYQGGKPASEPFDIMASDFGSGNAGLDWLTHLVHGRAIQLNFETLANAVDSYGQLLLFAASFHPIGAAVITGAELALLLTDTELKAQLDALAKDPVATLERFGAALTRAFEPDALFDLALNGNFEAPAFARETAGPPGRKAFGGKAVARILARIRRLAGAVALRLDAFQEKAQRPVRGIQRELAEHPRLAAMTHWAGEKIDAAGDLEGLVLRHRLAGPVYEAYMLYRRLAQSGEEGKAFDLLTQPIQGLATGLQGGLEAMKHLELPATLIPLPLALDALIELLILAAKRGKGRLKIAAALAAVLKEGADASGITPVLLAKFGDWIQSINADPNRLWQEELLPPLQEKLSATVGEAADQIEAVVRRTPLLGDYLGDGPFAADARRKGQRVNLPHTDGANTTVEASEEHDGAFDHPRVAEWAPEMPADDVTTVPSYATIAKMPDVFFDHLKKPTPAAGAGAGADSGPGQSGGNDPAKTGNAAPGLPEASPSPAGPAGPAAPTPGALSSRGDPLPPRLRAPAEARFGHDFSHVRLHRSPAAASLAARAGADALTSGSHIFLGSGLDPASGPGSRVFQHELAHVLQKQGPRPLGRSHAATPNLGAPNGGLRWSPAEEHAADQMAGRARSRPRSASRPVPVLGSHADGLSPSIKGELIGSFLEKISSPASGASLAQRVDRAHARAQDADLDPHVRTAARNVWAAVDALLRAGTVSASAPFETAKSQLLAHLSDRLGTLREGTGATQGSIPAASRVIDHLADGRQAPAASKTPKAAKPAKGKATAAATPEPQVLDARGLLTDLELYLAARSGIVLEFSPPTDLNRQLEKDPSHAFTLGARIRHVELHFVTDRSEHGRAIWTAAITNSWTGLASTDTHRFAVKAVLERRFGAPPPAIVHPASGTGAPATPTPDERLASGGFQPIWNSAATALAFAPAFVKEVETEMNPPRVSPDLMPPWPIYVGASRVAGGKFGATSVQQAITDLRADPHYQGGKPEASAKIAIHLSTHGDFTNQKSGYNLDDNDRNSHHIVQYLLPEYFANSKGSFQPFPALGTKKYPGVQGDASGVKTIGPTASGTANPIKVEETASPGRGNPMPAILLSATAHQNSDLHVTPQPDDLGSASQGYAIHRKYEQFLVDEIKPTPATPAAALTYLQGRSGEDAAAAKLHRAVQRTAGWLWNTEMKDALLKKMPDVEARYYLSQFAPRPAAAGSPQGATPAAKPNLLARLHGGTEPSQDDISKAIASVAGQAATWAIDRLTTDKGWQFPPES